MNSGNIYNNNDPSIYLLHGEIIESCRAIRKFKLEDFSNESGDSQLNKAKGFGDELQAISNVIDQTARIESLQQQEIIKLPKPTLRGLVAGLKSMEIILRQMRDFFEVSTIGNASLYDEELTLLRAKRDSIAANFYSTYEKLQESFNSLQFLYFSNELAKAKGDIELLSNKEVKEGISVHDKLYRSLASNHFEAGFFWLFVGMTGLIIAYLYSLETLSDIKAFALNANRKTSFSTETLISLASVRLFIFSLLTTFSFWSLKNYRLNKHNELLNRQKELALATFTEFSNAAVGDIEMRRVLLGKVATTIFDPQHLGYISIEKGNTEDSISVLNAADLLSRIKTGNNNS